MSESGNPFYGELVNMPKDERQEISDEEKTMEEQTRLMIEEAAYYLAKQRDFTPGYELQDWLEAEAQIKK